MIADLMIGMAAGKVGFRETLAACLGKIRGNPDAEAIFAHIDYDRLDAAGRSDKEARALEGIVLGVSDALLVKGMPCSASSKLLSGFVSPVESAVAEKLLAAGAVIAGKTRIPEFGIAPLTETETAAAVVDRYAEAVLGGMCHGVVGVDVDGAFRAAAAHAGIAAFKPGYGSVSRHGIVSLAPSLEGAALASLKSDDLVPLAQTIVGSDARDVTTNPEFSPDFPVAVKMKPKNTTVGVIEGLSSPECDAALEIFRKDGAAVATPTLPTIRYWNAIHGIICHGEASSQLGRYDGIRFGEYPKDARDWDSVYFRARAGFTPAAKRAALLGCFAWSHEASETYYRQALRLRTKVCDEFAKAWEQCDVLLVPASSDAAGQALRKGANLSGCSALSPAFKGVEIWAAPFKDENALRAGILLDAAV